ncbi:MAG: ribulose-phosphate 3-epimerase [Bacteroidales bacterium]|jgi:ribulose-phosphate 3-epimerase|nr:ribulose-phosphate 3-epimerase [Bacteroidales bacterium]
MKPLIAPSLLSADFSNLIKDIEMINNSEADWFHVDVMDGVFVPNISFGQPVIKHIKRFAKKPLDVHLMIVQPERYLASFKEAGADILSVQYEACTHLHRTVYAIKDLGMKAGVVLNPSTPVNVLEDIIIDVDMVLLMSVNPGFGGQKFIENTYHKLDQLRDLMTRRNADCYVEVDGGVTLDNKNKLIKHGANVLVAGNTVFASEDPIGTIAKLKENF